jgi:hypothetical protein
MRIIKVEKGKYLYNTKYDTLRIDKVNQAYPNLWWVYSENTNQTYGMFNSIKEFKEQRKSEELEQELNELSCRIVDELVEWGLVKDCTDTDNGNEWDTQDIVIKHIKKILNN